MPHTPRILWTDDEIDLLRPHVLFLEDKGYAVDTAANGADAINLVREQAYDLVLLDEQMPGMDGLETLTEIKRLRADVPVVMVTKSEEERLMEEALGERISDYLTKPVNPSQILLTCKRLLERTRLRQESTAQGYLQSFGEIGHAVDTARTADAWVTLYQRLVRYDMELQGDEGARQIFHDQYQKANRAFGQFVEDRYADWVATDRSRDDERPLLSHEVVAQHVLPHVEADDAPVVFFVIDCMRYDQWQMLRPLLQDRFDMQVDFHFGILPTATPYARNAIFSGLLPRDFVERFPQVWAGEDTEHSRNQHEELLLQQLVKRHRMQLNLRYDKLITTDDGRSFAQSVHNVTQHDLAAVVVNFVDILAHSRSDSDVLKELAPNEPAYRSLTRTWFEHSWLLEALQSLAAQGATVVLTTDHGAIRSLRSSKVIGDRETSTALRYKYGRNLQCDEEDAVFVRNPETFGLPQHSLSTNYIFAKEDFYFVYPTNFHHYENRYRDTMQHGGISMEEMMLPVATLTPKSRA
ncbi:T9SS response regulator signal transducer PorX [Salisaeta longa]|uniref:T9SS response regulator signal transducer PorX n=1 Tax=Salisaeta longa TaxID=503170 RepID=UPI0003B4B2CD|nr:response regulator [Salisaeta longa]